MSIRPARVTQSESETMPRKPIPTKSQAKEIARLFAGPTTFAVAVGWESGEWISPTKRCLIKNGWVENTCQTGRFPNGTAFEIWRLTETGIDALGDYLRNRRLKKTTEG